jgi:hypothetical protein
MGTVDLTGLYLLLQYNPDCTVIAFGLYPYTQGANPPIWVDIPMRIEKSSSAVNSGDRIENNIMSDCVNKVMDSLKLTDNDIKYSRHKATRAISHLWW